MNILRNKAEAQENSDATTVVSHQGDLKTDSLSARMT